MVKLYWTLWAIIASIALIVLVTGNFTIMTLVVFGFISFGMIFMGMISVLPSTVGHHAPAEPKVKPVKIEKEKEEKIFHAKTLATR